jgi:nitroreductase
MDVKDAINKRRSIRKWQNKEIPEEAIKELLEAARRAPSAKNVQSHKYFIARGKIKSELVEGGAFKRPFVGEAPLIIVCCADPSEYPESVEVDESPEHYAYIDLSIAASFLTLRATELGLGTVFIAWIYREKIREILGIPEKYIIPFVIPIGYPDENPPEKPRKNLNEIMI